MRLYSFFALMTCLYIGTDCILTINSLIGYKLPDILINSISILGYFFFITTYLSLVFILRHFKEQKWLAILLCTYLALTGVIYIGTLVRWPLNIKANLNITHAILLFTFNIGLFYVKAKVVAYLFKLLAILMLITSGIKVLVPMVFATHPQAIQLITASGLLAVVPFFVIFLLNLKMDLFLSQKKTLWTDLTRSLADNRLTG